MGAADGPRFAPAKPGSHPIVAPPCGCPECVAGPGIEFTGRSLDEILGPVTKVVTIDWCPACREIVDVTSVRKESGWRNTCRNAHTWFSFT